ncbi:MAG: glycosyltransferase family 4 protein [Thermoplasmata archaeon]|nr:glycosyltransferase family 4 protein [Thermoplasmata archaeon]
MRSGAGAKASELAVCINTQTPLVLFLITPQKLELMPPLDAESGLTGLVEGVDYRFSPGGVTRMVFPLVQRLLSSGVLESAHWISLNPTAPPTLTFSGVTLHNLALDPARLASYARTKEAIWGTVHGLPDTDLDEELFWSVDFTDYAYYNRITAERMRTLDQQHDFDLFYVHDFQQLPVGQMLNTLKPKVFRWHIPFEEEQIPEAWKPVLSTYFDSYDMVVVSTDRYLAALKAFGHSGAARRIYPYVDPGEYTAPPQEEVRRTCARLQVEPQDDVLLVVGRMDPMKGQDRAIRALAELLREHPRLKLVLVGNGSFSGSGKGLGLSKSASWRAHLEGVAEERGVRSRVVFTGHLPQRELDCFYERCSILLLPSLREGFGLVVVEGWLHHKPVIVTQRAGVAELIKEGSNGVLFDPDEPGELVVKMSKLLQDEGLRRRLGRQGFTTAKQCSLDAASEAEGRLFAEVVGA